jgi:hypothetical protein
LTYYKLLIRHIRGDPISPPLWRGLQKDTKLLELSAEGTILLELFATNFVLDDRGSR